MAATHLTLEEAANRLDITAEEFKRRLKTDPVFRDLDRGKIRDGTSFRFKESAVEELGRQLGIASNPELPLAALSDSSGLDSEDFKVPSAPVAKPKKTDDEPLLFASPDDDVFSLSAEEPKKKSGSDSDVRLEEGKKKLAGDKKEEGVPTEEMAIDPAGPGSAVIKGGSSAKLSAPKSSGKLTADAGKGLDKPGGGDSSEFELSLDADSDDFELKLNTDSSDEVALGEMPKEGGKRGGESGINLRDPADSGISLEKGKGKKDKPKPAAAPLKEDESSDEDFELTLDSSAASALKLEGLKGKGLDADSDSEFELTLDDSSESSLEHAAAESVEAADKRDIFETDFEIPPMDEASSEEIALDAEGSSDVEVELEAESDVEVEEVEEDTPVARRGRRVAAEEESDVDLADEDAEDESAAAALRGAKGRRRGEEDEDEDEEALAVPAGAYRPIPWGWVPPLFLFPAMVLVLLGGLMGWELLQTMYGYQQPRKPAAPLVRGLASQLDMPLNDQ